MKVSKELYIVIEFGGEYEDRWQIVHGVFSTKELAETFVNNHVAEQNKGILDEETYDTLWEELDDIWNSLPIEDRVNKSYEELIHERHPEYSVEQLIKTDEYHSYWYHGSFSINKLNYYDN